MIQKRITGVMTLVLLTVAAPSLFGQDQAPQAQPEAKDCCKVFQPQSCPAVKPCQRDACVIIQIAPIDKQDAAFTYNGTHSFMNIFSAGVARGVENATIRAMNAVKVCPTCQQQHEGECDPNKPAATAP